MSGVAHEIHDFDDSRMTMTMEQAATRLRQEVFTFKAQVADQSGLQEAVRTINNLATAQGKKGNPSLIDVKCLGCPKEFFGREEDFHQWSKMTVAFFAGMIKETEMLLQWSAEQATEITTTTAIDLEFLPPVTNVERGIRGVCAAADAHSSHGSHELSGE